LPHIQKLYSKIKPQGVTVVAMNYGDSAAVVNKYWKDEKFTFTPVLAADAVHDRFGVAAYPTNYVVDGNGKVLARGVGYDEAMIKAAFKKAGVNVD
jgi:hypothetical protein